MRRTAAALVLAALFAACGNATPIEPGDLQGLMDRELGDLAPDREGIGLAVAVVDGDNQATAAFGGVEEDWVFELGPVTQAFTGTVFADMVARGEVGKDDPISRYLPQGVQAPTQDGKEITLEHLATNSAALPRLPPNLVPDDPENPYAEYTEPMLFQAITNAQLVRPLGETLDESWYGYGLLGHLLANARGTSYLDLVASRVIGPLGMQSTVLAVPPHLEERLAAGHRGFRQVDHWDVPGMDAAVALRSTIGDMLLLLRASVDPASSTAGAALREAQTIKVSDGSRNFGYGWRQREDAGLTVVFQSGSAHGFFAYVGYAPEHRVGVAVLANVENNLAGPARRVIVELVRQRTEGPASGT